MRMRKGVLKFAVLAVVVLMGCGEKSAVPDSNLLQEVGFRPVETIQTIPDLQFENINGTRVSLSSLEGQVVLLNFWASWCPPCRAEMPALDRLNQRLEGGEFRFLAVNVQEPKDLVERFVEEFSIGFDVYLDPVAESAMAIGLSSLPTSLLIDRNGRIIAVAEGVADWESPEFLNAMDNWTR